MLLVCQPSPKGRRYMLSTKTCQADCPPLGLEGSRVRRISYDFSFLVGFVSDLHGISSRTDL
jgi:hypothetical protein